MFVHASITSEQAIAITEPDALRAYGDLTDYRVRVSLEPDGWHIDYEHKDANVQGGGPHFIIDQITGTILTKRYEQ